MHKSVKQKLSLLLSAVIISSSVSTFSFAASSSSEVSSDITMDKQMKELQTQKKVDFRKGEIIIKYKNGGNLEVKKAKIQNKIQSSLSSHHSFLPKSKQIFSEGVEVLSVDENEDVQSLAEELSKDPDVAYAQPNYIYHFDYTPQDPRFSEQWSLKNNTTAIDINAGKAWDITRGSSTVKVAVIDSGVAINHPDLQSSIFVNTQEIPGNGIDDDNNGYIDDVNGYDFYHHDNTVFDTYDEDLHGTHVTGTIAAAANTQGVIGVAPNVKIIPMKIGTTYGGLSDSAAIEAINYAKIMGASIANCSWGGLFFSDQALNDAIANSGILFCIAAGNDRANMEYIPVSPGGYALSNILTVAALDSNGNLASFSNYGSPVEVAAPGVSILSTLPKKDSDSGYDGDEYGLLSGTSMATPHVAGIAALVKSQYPTSTISDMVQKIKNGAIVDNAILNKVPGGLVVDAYDAVRSTASLSYKKITASENSLNIEWNPVTGATTYEVYFSTSTIPYYAGTSISISSLNAATNYIVRVVAKDALGNTLAEKRTIARTLSVGTGTGLSAEYYDDTAMNVLKVSRTENINFNWGSGSPDPSINSTAFSALWTGELEAKNSEEYTFYAQTQGAAKLWINGTQIFNKTTDTSDTVTEVSGTITLEAGKRYPIQLEYYESYSAASIKLLWSTASQTKEIIPTNRLYALANTAGTWEKAGESVLGLGNYTHAVVENGKMYMVVSDSFGDPRIEVFDDTQNKLVKLTDNPHILYQAAAILNNKIYCFYQDSSNNAAIDVYDIAAQSWSTKNTVPAYLSYNAAITSNGKMYLFGGDTNTSVQVYDPVNDAWTSVAQMPDNRINYALSEMNGSIYMTGGQTGANLSSVYCFDTGNNSWTQRQDMPIARYEHGSVALNGKIFALGGYIDGGKASSEVDVYDPTTNTWTLRNDMIIGRTNMGTAVYKGKMYVAYGGYGPATYPYYDSYTPTYATTYKISGYIKPDLTSTNPQIKAGFKVVMNGLAHSAVTDSNGYFEINGIPSYSSGYVLKVTKDQYLYREIKNVKIKASNLQIGSSATPVDMWAGDVVADNALNMNDIMYINACVGTVLGDPGFKPECDLNMDNQITSADVDIVVNHFGAIPSSYPNLF